MCSVRLARFLAVTLYAFGCGHEEFDLLPPPDEAAEGGTSGTAGIATGGTFPTGGRGGSMSGTGGRSGRDGGPSPEPDCPSYDPYCLPCESAGPRTCPPGLWCDVFRHYCAPYCGMTFDGMLARCFEPALPVCDEGRSVCVECTSPTHCNDFEKCELGKCLPKPPPECFNNSQCENPDEPFCFEGKCQPCGSNFHCAQGERCMMGRCEPDGP